MPVDLEDYQQKRLDEGRAFATIDMEIKIAQTMVTKAFDNDKVNGDALKSFRKVKKLLKGRCHSWPENIKWNNLSRYPANSKNQYATGWIKIYRDSLLGHSLKGMDAHYIVITDESLTKAMNKHTTWLDMQLELANVDQKEKKS